MSISWFESNQCGIETEKRRLTRDEWRKFESNQCGIETFNGTSSKSLCKVFESNQCGIETPTQVFRQFHIDICLNRTSVELKL